MVQGRASPARSLRQRYTDSRMTAGELQEKFTRAGNRRAGILMLSALDALSMVQEASRHRIAVLGIDAFRLSPTTTQPDMEHSIDLSWPPVASDPWAVAVAFLQERRQLGLHFEVVLADVGDTAV